jgi:hypothetical protein
MKTIDCMLFENRGILGFGTWVGAPPRKQFQGFFYLEGIPLPIVTNLDIISYAHLFPNEGIEMLGSPTAPPCDYMPYHLPV